MTEPIAAADLSILPYDDALAAEFRAINAEWIDAMFVLEDTDRDVLDHPRERIIVPGGDILFVAAAGLGVVGACALQKTGERQFELTKMGVRASARERKAGEFLLDAIIARARAGGRSALSPHQRAVRGGDPPLREGGLRPRRGDHARLRRALCAVRRGDALAACNGRVTSLG